MQPQGWHEVKVWEYGEFETKRIDVKFEDTSSQLQDQVCQTRAMWEEGHFQKIVRVSSLPAEAGVYA